MTRIGLGGAIPIASPFRDNRADPTVNSNLNQDYTTPFRAICIPPPGEIWKIVEIRGSVEDTQFAASRYGGIMNGLTNGISLTLTRDGKLIQDLLGGLRLTTNAGLQVLLGAAELSEFGAGDATITGKANLVNAFGVPIIIDGTKKFQLELTLRDDLSALTSHRWQVSGFSSKRYR